MTISAAPTLMSIAAVIAAGRLVPRPMGIGPSIIWWIGLTLLATAVLWLADRALRRLLPVAALFKLSLVFPDRAPSRFKTAIRAGTVRQLQRQLESGEYGSATPQHAAEQLIGLAAALNAHDRMTRGHTERVRAYSVMIGEEMGLDSDQLELLNWSGLVHDIGKLAVPTEILNKPGKPTDEEWTILRNHPRMADALIEPLRPWLGEWAESATQHHERFDGGGYPNSLAGDGITLAGRIVAVADAYDVMTSTRSYKKPMATAVARAELADNAGTQFDPVVVRAFLNLAIGRLRLVMGPLSSLIQFPAGSATLGSSVATGAGAVGAVAVAALSGAFAPAPEPLDPTPEIVTFAAPDPAPEPEPVQSPTAVDIDLVVVEDQRLQTNVLTMIDEPIVSLELLDQPRIGTAWASDAGVITYEPGPDFHGTVSVTYRACFVDGSCDEGTMTITVGSENDAPVAGPDDLTMAEDAVAIADVLGNDHDVDDDPLSIAEVRVIDHPDYPLSNIAVVIEDGKLRVTPAPNTWGTALIEYTVDDGRGLTAISTLTVHVESVEDLPVATPDTLTAYENTAVTFDVLANDFDEDGDPLTIIGVDYISGGEATTDGTTVSFTPDPRYFGPAEFTYLIIDGKNSATATATIDVIDITTQPLVGNDSATTAEDQPATINILANDIAIVAPLDTSTVAIVRPPANGTASWDGSAARYQPDGDWFGDDSFDYVVCDLLEFCNLATVSVTVDPVNDGPTITAGPDVIAFEDAGPRTLPGWATAMSTGPANESGQTLTVTVANSNPALFTT
ncbi:MAG: Ig-like domain-containing protein, partial [Acidimicrobiales bacterium]